MRKAVMGFVLVGVIALAGVMVPRIAWSHDADEAGPGAYGWCGGGGHGWHGPGMMGYGYGGMMGPGMMGPGYGAGMWGAGGWGPGMMGGTSALGAIWRLDLSDAQRTQVDKIAEGLRRANWATMGRLMDARARLNDLEEASAPDPKDVSAAYADVSRLEQGMVEAAVHARNEARAVLTPSQRQQLEQWRAQAWGAGDRGPAAARR
jgi:Spy/CpxP family protein refolding chaperone